MNVKSLALAACSVLCVVGILGAQDTLFKPVDQSPAPSRYSMFFPNTSDPELQALFSDPAVEWYTDNERPKVFQHDLGTPGRAHFISVYRDIGPGGPRFSNGNGEWPWAHPAVPVADGRARVIFGAKVTSYRTGSVALQRGSIVIGPDYFRVEPRSPISGTTWQFGAGTEFVEINTNRIVDGDYCFKVHRMTMQPSGEWLFRVYRPFTSQKEYEDATGTKAQHVGRRTLRNSHLVKVFEETRDIWKVPRIDPGLAKKLLLETDFKLATDDDFIPTTEHNDQIYPKGYLGAYIGNGTDQQNCRNCHRDVLEEVRKFDNGEWYGHIRGGGKDIHGAGVFSWYPRQ